ncbi:MAG: DUF116 domain-containing protein [Desulfurispora sp.]|uniref:DUF116 domain-containing protein n=1 Tax=Desulfurispora sp. TaxID=3014275 RepID=UPI00404A8BF8
MQAITVESVDRHTRKRLFLVLLAVSLLLTGLLAVGIWVVIFHSSQSLLYKSTVVILVAGVLTTVGVAASGLLGIFLTLLRCRRVTVLQGPMRVALNLFFPLVFAVGKLLQIDRDLIRRSFIEVNNQLVRAMQLHLQPRELLLLAPHCLQLAECPHKITADMENCRRCGRCPVNSLLQIRDAYGIGVGIATGGTLARALVKKYRPRAIVAIACERDLTSGIQDANPIPVLGVTNLRPHGPCYNTTINIEKVKQALEHFLDGAANRM